MRIALKELIGKILYVFLDDIIVYSESVDQHLERLEILFSTLNEHNLKISPGKCKLLMQELPFLGFLITRHGVIPDPIKTLSIQKLPPPKNARDIKSFMGMINYYSRHNLADFAKPLHSLLKKNTKFEWTSQCQQSFDYFKKCLMSAPILQYPNFENIFFITTDASKVAISATLSQGEPKNSLPVAYASRTLTDVETRYSTAEKEVLAIVWGVRHFKTDVGYRYFEIFSDCKALQWLLQLKSPNSRLNRWKFELQGYDFKIHHIKGKENVVADCLSRFIEKTPSKIISVLTRAKAKELNRGSNYLTPEQNMLRIQEQKEEEIEEIPPFVESTDVNLKDKYEARLYLREVEDTRFLADKGINLGPGVTDTVIYKENEKEFIMLFASAKANEVTLSKLLTSLSQSLNDKGINTIYSISCDIALPKRNYEKFIDAMKIKCQQSSIKFLLIRQDIVTLHDKKEIEKVLKDFHDNPLAGNQGVNRTAYKIAQQFKWKGLRKDVQNYVKNCSICQRAKPNGVTKQPMQITSTASTQFSTIHVDCVGPLVESVEGFKYIFTFQDDLTRYFGAVPVVDHTAEVIAKAMVENIILRFGIPQVIVSDLGTEFVNDVMNKMFKMLGIKHNRTTAYHPQSNGVLERSHSTLKSILRCNTDNMVADWPNFVPFATFVVNSSLNRSIGYTPHELVFAYKLSLPSNLTRKPDPRYDFEGYLTDLKFKLQSAHHLARKNLDESKERNKTYYDEGALPKEYMVGDKVWLKNESRPTKLHNPFIGPYEVTEVISDVNVKLRIKGKDKIVHLNRIKKFNSVPESHNVEQGINEEQMDEI